MTRNCQRNCARTYFIKINPFSFSDNSCPKYGYQSGQVGVISTCVDCFLYGGDLYRFEYNVSYAVFLAKPHGGTCTLAGSDSLEEVLHRASFLLGNGFGVYHLLKNNCEDFTIYWKTGLLVHAGSTVGRSEQAASLVAAASANIVSSPLRFLTVASFGGLATAVGYGMYCVSRLVSDIGVRQDVVKTTVENLVKNKFQFN